MVIVDFVYNSSKLPVPIAVIIWGDSLNKLFLYNSILIYYVSTKKNKGFMKS